MKRDLLKLLDLKQHELAEILSLAALIKSGENNEEYSNSLLGKYIGVVMQKPSLRTRVSFEVACNKLGAHPILLTGNESAFSRGESPLDTIKVLERFLDAIVIRTFSDSLLDQCAAATSMPVINALTDGFHPCQGLADILTIQENFGSLDGLTLAYVGDGSNNMAHTYLEAGALTGMQVRIATPKNFQPSAEVLTRSLAASTQSGAKLSVHSDPREAVAGAQVVITDTWASMGQEEEHDVRLAQFMPYQVNTQLMAHAAADAIFLHCLPAHRGEEVTDEVIDSAASRIYDEAENRLHAQMALLSWIFAQEVGVCE